MLSLILDANDVATGAEDCPGHWGNRVSRKEYVIYIYSDITLLCFILFRVFVEKILRIQPNVKKVLGKEVFRVLKEKWGAGFQSFISEKVVAVAGDVSSEDLGIEDLHLKEEILKETDLVLNFAAITKFDERYDVALGTNTFGALHVLNFSKKCAKIKLLIQVSTGN
ncbi:unnamed protein product [Linum tenue]|uniref:Fatty acyl-CoA reductase n=1 Tax=Linum tenue TaxID=586396 RepID=A0AAV0R736_9ROSI|nr:unnamed protein product [Linum tenue]